MKERKFEEAETKDNYLVENSKLKNDLQNIKEQIKKVPETALKNRKNLGLIDPDSDYTIKIDIDTDLDFSLDVIDEIKHYESEISKISIIKRNKDFLEKFFRFDDKQKLHYLREYQSAIKDLESKLAKTQVSRNKKYKISEFDFLHKKEVMKIIDASIDRKSVLLKDYECFIQIMQTELTTAEEANKSKGNLLKYTISERNGIPQILPEEILVDNINLNSIQNQDYIEFLEELIDETKEKTSVDLKTEIERLKKVRLTPEKAISSYSDSQEVNEYLTLENQAKEKKFIFQIICNDLAQYRDTLSDLEKLEQKYKEYTKMSSKVRDKIKSFYEKNDLEFSYFLTITNYEFLDKKGSYLQKIIEFLTKFITKLDECVKSFKKQAQENKLKSIGLIFEQDKFHTRS